jgi:hypothetical protein
MNTKVEPVLGDMSDNNIAQSINLEEPKDISKLISIIRKQAEVNEEIISALGAPDLSKKEQMEMIQMLNDGSQKSSMFVKLLQNNEKDIGIELNETIPPKGKVNDKFNNFKNMIASARASIDPSMVFRNPLKPDWYEAGLRVVLTYKVISSKSKKIKENLDSFLSQSANKLNVAATKVQSVNNFFQSQFTLIGERKNVKILEKRFTKLFDLLGVNPKEILHSSELTENLSAEELNKKISIKLEKSVNAFKEPADNHFKFTILNELTPELQLSMAQTILWPKLHSAIKESMEVSQTLQASQSDNRYLRMVTEFAEENKFHPDLVIHSLKNNPDLLSGYPKSKLLLSNTKEILENSAKYGKIVINNFTYLDTLVKASDDLHTAVKGLPVPQEAKDSFNTAIDNTVVFSDAEKVITYGQLKANILSVKQEEKTTVPKLNKNGA